MRLPDLGSDGAGRSAQPVYRRIAEQIRAQIETGELAAGDRLPPIRALAGDLGVNRDTVALAYEALAAEGQVESTVGRGTFVRGALAHAAGEGGAPFAEAATISIAPEVEQLLAFENARPRFGPAPPDAIGLHSLIPDPSLYPVEAFRRCLNRVVSDGGAELFLYGSSQGHAGLREAIARRYNAAGMGVSEDQLVLCHGASQGISLAIRLLAQRGDAIAVEVPTYHNVLATLVALGVQPAPVPMDEQGPDIEALERVLSRPEVKAFYCIPTFHNPMGTTQGLAHRRALLAAAARAGKPVIEDAFEMDLRFTGRAASPLAALDTSGLVVHLSSFSKSLFPGLRVGAITARGRLVEGIVALKHATDLSDSMPLQAALAEFVRSGGYDRHLGRIRRVLRGRRDALLGALEREMPEGSTWTRPEGGYQVWVTLPGDIDTRDLLADAAREGVLFAPGSQFLPDRSPSPSMRLTVAQVDEAQIERGVSILAELARRALADAPGRRTPEAVRL